MRTLLKHRVVSLHLSAILLSGKNGGRDQEREREKRVERKNEAVWENKKILCHKEGEKMLTNFPSLDV